MWSIIERLSSYSHNMIYYRIYVAFFFIVNPLRRMVCPFFSYWLYPSCWDKIKQQISKESPIGSLSIIFQSVSHTSGLLYTYCKLNRTSCSRLTPSGVLPLTFCSFSTGHQEKAFFVHSYCVTGVSFHTAQFMTALLLPDWRSSCQCTIQTGKQCRRTITTRGKMSESN